MIRIIIIHIPCHKFETLRISIMSLCQTKNLKQEHNKIRKRGCSSPSSSSTFSRKYRFKRAILIGKKSGYSTPAPIWKTSSKSPSMATHHHHHITKNTAFHSFRSGLVSKEKEVSVSARKLAATLWEINDLTPSRIKKESMKSNKNRDIEKVESLCRSTLLGPQKLDLDLSSNRLFSEVNY